MIPSGRFRKEKHERTKADPWKAGRRSVPHHSDCGGRVLRPSRKGAGVKHMSDADTACASFCCDGPCFPMSTIEVAIVDLQMPSEAAPRLATLPLRVSAGARKFVYAVR